VPQDEPRAYRQRCPEKTVLYSVIQQHLESFLQHVREASDKRLPKYVEKKFRRYLECGLHAHGFARAECETCGDELLLSFSCKLRGICPSCNARRMSNTAAHLIDHVIAPDLTLRQWVLTVPFELRLLLAAKPETLSAIGRIFVQEIQRWQREHARALGYARPETAAVSFCQRFGSRTRRGPFSRKTRAPSLRVRGADRRQKADKGANRSMRYRETKCTELWQECFPNQERMKNFLPLP